MLTLQQSGTKRQNPGLAPPFIPRGGGTLKTKNFLSPKLGGPSRPKFFKVQNRGGGGSHNATKPITIA